MYVYELSGCGFEVLWSHKSISTLAKKVDYESKISDIEKKYFTTSDYDNFTNERLNAKKKLVNKYDNFGIIDNSDLDKKVETLGTNAELKVEEDNSENVNIWFKAFYWSKLVFQWWITKFLNISINFWIFRNASWSYRNNNSIEI